MSITIVKLEIKVPRHTKRRRTRTKQPVKSLSRLIRASTSLRSSAIASRELGVGSWVLGWTARRAEEMIKTNKKDNASYQFTHQLKPIDCFNPL
jgi:hypothetical protein